MSDKTQQQMSPIFSIASNDFDKDLGIIKRVFSALEQLTHTEQGFKLSDRAVFAAGWWFYEVYFIEDFTRKMFEFMLPSQEHNKRAATKRIVDSLQGQLRKYGSDSRIKMHGDIPFAAPWWAWLMK